MSPVRMTRRCRSRRSRNIARRRIQAISRNCRDAICLATRPARQALAHPRRHRPRRAAARREGKDVIGLGAGEPDFDTPAHIAQAGIDAIRSGFTRYTNVDGIDGAQGRHHRQVPARQRARLRAHADPGLLRRQADACSTCAWRVLDPGDEAVIPAPYWVSYPDMVLLADGLPVMPFAGAAQGYKITPRQLAAAITPQDAPVAAQQPVQSRPAPPTRAPSCGRWARCCSSIRASLIGTDDMYEKIYWGAGAVQQPASRAVPELYDAHRHHQRRAPRPMP